MPSLAPGSAAPRGARLLAAFLAILLPWPWPGPALPAGEDDPAPATARAEFLCNLTRFVEWPPGAFAEPTSPVVICVHGPDPFAGRLASLAAGTRVQNRPVVVTQISAPTSARACHVVFEVDTGEENEAILLEVLEGLPVLTVGESATFLERGGVIVLRREGDRILFDVNLEAAEYASLTVSSKLLRLARRVRTAEGRDARLP